MISHTLESNCFTQKAHEQHLFLKKLLIFRDHWLTTKDALPWAKMYS